MTSRRQSPRNSARSGARRFSGTAAPPGGKQRRGCFARGRRFRSQPTTGERNQSTSQGLANQRFDGPSASTPHASDHAEQAGEAHREQEHGHPGLGNRPCITWAEVHSSSPRCEMCLRYRTRTMASRASQAWYGSSAASARTRSRSWPASRGRSPSIPGGLSPR